MCSTPFSYGGHKKVWRQTQGRKITTLRRSFSSGPLYCYFRYTQSGAQKCPSAPSRPLAPYRLPSPRHMTASDSQASYVSLESHRGIFWIIPRGDQWILSADKLSEARTVESSSKFLRAASPRCRGGLLNHTQSKLCVWSVLRFRGPAVVWPKPPCWHLSTHREIWVRAKEQWVRS